LGLTENGGVWGLGELGGEGIRRGIGKGYGEGKRERGVPCMLRFVVAHPRGETKVIGLMGEGVK